MTETGSAFPGGIVVVAPRGCNRPAAVLPERLIHVTGRTVPGRFAGEMGSR